jgi:protein-S-isoprenylcysteine O-methyltransferase Ste14
MMQWYNLQFGWLNLWILTLILNGSLFLISIGERGRAGIKRQFMLPPMSSVERVFYVLAMIPQMVMYLYTFFVPFTTNMALLGAGLVLFVIGLAMTLKQTCDFAAAPSDKLITNGIYRISRNPGCFGQVLAYLGMGLTGGSWFIVTFAAYWFIACQWMGALEERFCMKSWPEEFAEYKRKVAKNFLFF